MSVIDMRCRGYLTRFGAAVFAAALVSPVHSASNLSTSERLDRIERQLEGRGLIDLLNQLEKLQNDVQQLRGDIEVQNHRLEDMQRRQKDLYLDIDRRLRQLEPEQPAGAAGVMPVPGEADVSAPPSYQASPSYETPPSYQASPSYETPSPYQVPPSYETPSPAATPPVTIAPPPVAPAPAEAPANTAEQQAEYEKALAILREGRYIEAATAFNRFLEAYPGSVYSDNAYYWLGETYYVTRDFDRSLAAFKQLVGSYPVSPKVPGARLKIGYIYYEQKDWAAARQELNSLLTGYPGSTEARLADDRLQRMKKEGH
ncbi:MAG: tol-pal system protein YbgF [Gammaproteobacteria bacterium]